MAVKVSNLGDFELLQTNTLSNKYCDISRDLPKCINSIEHKIVLTSDKPVHSKPYAVSFSKCDSLKCDIENMIEKNITRPSTPPYASPVVIVKKEMA